MKIPFLTVALKRAARSRLRRIMRGYRFLKESNQLGLIVAVQNDLINTHFGRVGRNASKIFFGTGVAQAELITRQYLLARIGGIGLTKALLCSLGVKGSPVVYPMPKLWQQVVARHGFSVARMRCSFAWAGHLLLFWGYGVLSIVRQIYVSLREAIRPQLPALGRYVYFVGLVAGNLPQPCRDGHSHDIVTWYIRWKGRAEHIDALCHGVVNVKVCNVDGFPVVFSPYLIPPLDTFTGLVRFLAWALAAALRSVLDLFRGHWWHSMLLAESTKAAMVRFQETDKLAKDYVFHNSGTIYRPLWTYEAEDKGLRITSYFYSTNMEGFKRQNGHPIQVNIWQAMNWPLYLVWNEYQADFMRRAVGEAANIEVVGPIWFHAGSIQTPELPPRSVAVFDVQPHRSSRYQILGESQEYYVPKTANQFLLDIHTVIRECGGAMVHKRKRNIGKILHPKYEALVKTLAKADDVFSIEPDTSAIRVIEGCSAVISMPFTSTALLGRELNKQSVYYDPHGVVQKDDRAAHGIQILCGKDELRDWLTGVFESTENAYTR
ncbi:MAG: polysaccharide biosynthesis PFTS motif protein [Candidatus Omnitrophota bacterium]|nr:polysaccharide biosynthesis PFTS motif protein [Candidatus Omnitrophota bacterium]